MAAVINRSPMNFDPPITLVGLTALSEDVKPHPAHVRGQVIDLVGAVEGGLAILPEAQGEDLANPAPTDAGKARGLEGNRQHPHRQGLMSLPVIRRGLGGAFIGERSVPGPRSREVRPAVEAAPCPKGGR